MDDKKVARENLVLEIACKSRVLGISKCGHSAIMPHGGKDTRKTGTGISLAYGGAVHYPDKSVCSGKARNGLLKKSP